MGKLLTTSELALTLGVSIQTIWKWVKDGKIPCLRAAKGGWMRFDIDEVRAAMTQKAKANT